MIPSPPTEVSEEHARNIARIIARVYSSVYQGLEYKVKSREAIGLYWEEVKITNERQDNST